MQASRHRGAALAIAVSLAWCLLCGCTAGAGRVSPTPVPTLTPREVRINAILLQPVDLPLGWGMSFFNDRLPACTVYWRRFERRGHPWLRHEVIDCVDEAAAKVLYAEKAAPTKASMKVKPFGGAKPAHADQYAAQCEPPLILRERCVVVARYGRVVSFMEVSREVGSTGWPYGVDLLRWSAVKDEALAALAD